MRRFFDCFILLLVVSIGVSVGCSKKQESGSRYIDSPLVKKGAVTLVELGALSCKPCQLMVPIMEELTEEYSGIVDIRFINVHEDDTAARTFAIMVIPTQIIYDRQLKEVFRHIGFIEKELLEKELTELLQAGG